MVSFNGQNSHVSEPGAAGLPQGSPLSLTLFLFFNADLVQQIIRSHQGSIAFVDDYTAWVTRETAVENTQKIQERVVTRAEAWEISSGATFQPEKTAFIHFSQKIEKVDARLRSMIIRGCAVYPSETVKVLGVVLDRQLRSELSSIVHFVQLPPVTPCDPY
jgi:hypothetical protein